MSGWEGYIYQIQNDFDHATQQYKLTNCCEHAALIGLDGTPWAATSGFNLGAYEFGLELEDGSKEPVQVNVFKIVEAAVGGNFRASKAGIRMNNQKYMFIKHNPDVSSVYLSRQGGGGSCVAKAGTCLVIGVWDKSGKMSNE
jgi:hypothetical protein